MSEPEDSSSENVETSQGASRPFAAATSMRCSELLDPEIEVYMPRSWPTPAPSAVTTDTRDGLRNGSRRGMTSTWSSTTIEAVGRSHVVSAPIRRRAAREAASRSRWISYLWDVRDGHAVALHLYPSRDEAIEVAERREREASE